MSKQMKKRIFSGPMCEQIVYNVPAGTGSGAAYDPEKQKRARFEDKESYNLFKEGISRRNHARSFMENFAPGDLYTTLTFDDEWEVHTFQEAKQIRRNFARALHRKYPEAVFFLYMGRGKSTHRVHFHMVSTCVIPEAFIREKWKYGSVVHARRLREHNWYDGIDCGADFTGLANYLFGHWTPEVGGHRWFQTKNAKKPVQEKAREVHIAGGYTKDRKPRTPTGYKLVQVKATKYGCMYFKYVKIPPTPEGKTKKKQSGKAG